MRRDLESLLANLVQSGAVLHHASYARADLLPRLAQATADPERAFALVRESARESPVPGQAISIVVSGAKRGTRYRIVLGDGELPAATPGPEGCSPGAPARPAKNNLPAVQSPGASIPAGPVEIHFGDNLDVLAGIPSGSIDLIYIDPPFNTGKVQARTQIRTEQDENGDRTGFQGKRYRTIRLGRRAYEDAFDDYLGFLEPRFVEAYRVLKPTGSFFLHLDYREVHYAKVLLDQIFGRDSFLNEIIWAYDYGARSTSRWSSKHDNILWYAKDPNCYTFNFEEMDRIPYMAPGLVGPEKAERGKTPTDTWWHTIVSPNGHEKTGYPTQKPLGILTRIVKVHSRPGDHLLDFFAGSGSFGEAAALNGRRVTLVDANPEAIEVMKRRLARFSPTLTGVEPEVVCTSTGTPEPETEPSGFAPDRDLGVAGPQQQSLF